MTEMAKKRGRPLSFPVEEVKKLVAVNKERIFVNDQVIGKNNEIWKELSATLNYAVTAAHLYTSIHSNRHGILDSLNVMDSPDSRSGNSPISSTHSESSRTSNNSFDTEDDDDEDLLSAKGHLNFSITLSKVDWMKMKPEKVSYKDKKGRNKHRNYLKMKRYAWTHIINSYFWKQTNLPCKIAYHGGRLCTSEAVHAISVHGTCSHCKSKLYAFMDRLPDEDENAVFEFTYKGAFSMQHPKGLKRNLAGEEKKRAVNKIMKENMSALAYQRLEADKIMCFGDQEPAHLPTTKQLRDAKATTERALRVNDNPILSLAKAMYDSRFRNIIRDLSYDKFQIRYHSASQIHVYKRFCKENFPVSAAIDATGGVVKRLKRVAGVKSGPILLYSFVVRDEATSKIYPVATLLSERQDTETIRHWLATFLQCRVPPPHEIVTDMSLALMSACVQAFTSSPSLDAYLHQCVSLVNVYTDETLTLPHSTTHTKQPESVPECFVRNDVAHVVKMLASWRCFRVCGRVTKQFFMRSLCQVLQSTTISEVKTLLRHIMTVALSETEGTDSLGNETSTEKSKTVLLEVIGGLVGKEREMDEEAHDSSILIQKNTRKLTKTENNPFYQMVQTIKLEVDSSLEIGNRGNQQYLPDIVKHILDISPLIPCWTSVMVPIFRFGGVTASSAPVETDFKILKAQIFKNKNLPMRVDDFVFSHMPSIEGAMKIAAASQADESFNIESDCYSEESTCHQQEDNRPVKSRTEDSSVVGTMLVAAASQTEKKPDTITEQICLQVSECDVEPALKARIEESSAFEDWKGVATLETKGRKHTSYLQKNPELSRSDLSASKPSITIGLLKNGNKYELEPSKVGGDSIVLTNTCAFDSVTQLFAAGYCDSKQLRTVVDSSSDNAFFEIVKDITNNGISRKTYNLRARMLMLISVLKVLPQGVKLLKCETPVAPLVSLLLKDRESLLERSLCNSPLCPLQQRDVNRVPLSVSILDRKDIISLERLVLNELQSRTSHCFQMKGSGDYCHGERTLTKQLTLDYLLIEPVETGTTIKLLQCILKIRELPRKLVINEKTLLLRGCIGFQGTDIPEDVGHYVAYIMRSDGLWETYNDLKDRKDPTATKQDIKCHLILYTI